jgi:hypothetical protein
VASGAFWVAGGPPWFPFSWAEAMLLPAISAKAFHGLTESAGIPDQLDL